MTNNPQICTGGPHSTQPQSHRPNRANIKYSIFRSELFLEGSEGVPRYVLGGKAAPEEVDPWSAVWGQSGAR